MVHVLGKGPKTLVKFILECLRVGGTPIIVPRYGGSQLEYEGMPSVQVRCYGAADRLKGGTIVDIPKDLIELSMTVKGDWRYILEKLGISNPLEFREKLLTMPESEFEQILKQLEEKAAEVFGGGAGGVAGAGAYTPF